MVGGTRPTGSHLGRGVVPDLVDVSDRFQTAQRRLFDLAELQTDAAELCHGLLRSLEPWQHGAELGDRGDSHGR